MSDERIKRPRKTRTITFRLTDETFAALEQASVSGPYRLSHTAIVERGIKLAMAEIAAMPKKEPHP